MYEPEDRVTVHFQLENNSAVDVYGSTLKVVTCINLIIMTVFTNVELVGDSCDQTVWIRQG